jgi:hypothetical protein
VLKYSRKKMFVDGGGGMRISWGVDEQRRAKG